MSEEKLFALRGRTALITGAAKRLGREITLALAGEGVNSVIHCLTSTREAEDLKEHIGRMGVNAWVLQADLGRAPQYEALFTKALQYAGSIDILINSASIFPPGGLQEITLEALSRNVEINAWVPLFFCREFARQASCGRIINVLDTRITGGDSTHLAYHLSKIMLAQITKILALELAPGITVNAVAPGLILPPAGRDESYMEKLKDAVPLKMTGHPAYISDAVLFLLRSSFITGQIIYVDGGRHLMCSEVS
jgi:pteridine reductase